MSGSEADRREIGRLRQREAELTAEIIRLRAARDGPPEGETRWRGMFEHMHEGFALCEMIFDSQGQASDFRVLEINQAWQRQTGVAPAEAVGQLASVVFPGLPHSSLATYGRVVATGAPAHFECEITAIGQWFEVLAYRIAPGCFAVLFLNITERKTIEARMALLAREVDHRAKNALAVVQAALRLTRAEDLTSYRQAVEGRIGALARAQRLLASDKWTGADLRELLRGELAPFTTTVPGMAPRVRLEGPPVPLPAEAAQPLAMAMHELATNAVKHGALSVAPGEITVDWHIERRPLAAPLLHLRWTERHGPVLAGGPARQGFGLRVLDTTLRGQLGGHVSLAWEAEGLVCVMGVPLKPARELVAVA